MSVVSDLMKEAFLKALHADDLRMEADQLIADAKELLEEAYKLDIESDFLKMDIVLEIAARRGGEKI